MSASQAAPGDWSARKASIAAHLPELYAAVGVSTADPMRHHWNTADRANRRALLMVASYPAALAGMRWEELAGETQATIKRRLLSMRNWINRVADDIEGAA